MHTRCLDILTSQSEKEKLFSSMWLDFIMILAFTLSQKSSFQRDSAKKKRQKEARMVYEYEFGWQYYSKLKYFILGIHFCHLGKGLEAALASGLRYLN